MPDDGDGLNVNVSEQYHDDESFNFDGGDYRSDRPKVIGPNPRSASSNANNCLHGRCTESVDVF